MKKMTRKQEEVYEYIVEYVKGHLYPPSIREIAAAVDLRSPSSVFFHLKALEEKGFIEIAEKEPRAIRLKGYTIVPNEVLIRLYEDYARRR